MARWRLREDLRDTSRRHTAKAAMVAQGRAGRSAAAVAGASSTCQLQNALSIEPIHGIVSHRHIAELTHRPFGLCAVHVDG